ncbi:hypothetical protein GRJ2_001714100 [Grus japonensis]|uniref:Uncharacterized protein n=1 Tax=Grus japonensis TaxID=30415 RepID=A0ABC9X494_GRUJA
MQPKAAPAVPQQSRSSVRSFPRKKRFAATDSHRSSCLFPQPPDAVSSQSSKFGNANVTTAKGISPAKGAEELAACEILV